MSWQFDPSAAPKVDLEHPLATKYCLIVDLIQNHEAGPDAARLLLPMLDNTEFMASVLDWIEPAIARDEMRKGQFGWCDSGYSMLLERSFAHGHCRNGLELCKHCLVKDRQEMLVICADELVEKHRVELIEEALTTSYRPESIVYLLDRFRDIPEVIQVVCDGGYRISELAVWHAILKLYPIKMTDKMMFKMAPEIMADCYQSGLLSSRKILNHLVDVVMPKANYDLDYSDPEYDALRSVLDSHQLDLYQAILQAINSKYRIYPCQFLINLLRDVHMEDNWLFWKLLEIVFSCKNRLNISSKQRRTQNAVITWLCETYHIDLFSRGSYIFQLTHQFENSIFELRKIFHELTKNCETQFWFDNGLLDCAISRYPLVMEDCKAYQIDHLYMYSTSIRFSTETSAFVDKSNGSMIEITEHLLEDDSLEEKRPAKKVLARKTPKKRCKKKDSKDEDSEEEERPVKKNTLKGKALKKREVRDSSSDDEPIAVAIGNSHPARLSDDENQTDLSDCLLVNVIDLAHPETIHQGYLPVFLIPMARAMAARAKPALR